ncbi:MAG: ribose-5-phosphate isomerase RpiA [Shinella sp.]|nr:ribose-5-phosphate isomerase RpiA [Shinella sp.]
MLSQDEAKRLAGVKAIEEFVRDGMKLGLGSGTTSHLFVRELGKRVAGGMKLTCTTTSNSTTAVAREVGIELTDINDIGELDLTIDGPDEIDHEFRMIKGGGACLLWEKIVAHASKRMITICDESKIVDRLGRFPLPVEVVQYAWKQTERAIGRTLGNHGVGRIEMTRRMRDGTPVITDSGNFIIDCHCGSIGDPEGLELELNRIPGVVENGLFTRESAGMVVGCFDGNAYVKFR